MRIGQIILRVEDLERSVRFWSQSLGFDVTMQSGSFAFIDANGIQLAINEIDDVPDDESLTEIVIEVEDIRSSYRELSDRGVPFEVEPRAVTSDGERELWAAHFHDPDGHLGSVVGWVG
jgi:catechol 2,3-dioxygenase-like lactoylglutathione lyase family enzyme